MIIVHRLNGLPVYINPDLILFAEALPDTLITLRDGEKLPVRESIPVIQQKILDFKRACFSSCLSELTVSSSSSSGAQEMEKVSKLSLSPFRYWTQQE